MKCYMCEEKNASTSNLVKAFDENKNYVCWACTYKLRNLAEVFEEGMVIELNDGREIHISIKEPANKGKGQVTFSCLAGMIN